MATGPGINVSYGRALSHSTSMARRRTREGPTRGRRARRYARPKKDDLHRQMPDVWVAGGWPLEDDA